MEKTPNKVVLDLLYDLKNRLEQSYNNFKNMYENAKDEATEKKAIDNVNVVIKEHKAVIAYLKKYHGLFTALNTPQYNGNTDIINQINNLEKEVLEKYTSERKAAPASTPSSTPALEKGKKYGVTDTRQANTGWNKFTGVLNCIGALILAYCALNALKGLDFSSAFDGLVSPAVYGGASIASGVWAFFAGRKGIRKLTGDKKKEENSEEENSKSK